MTHKPYLVEIFWTAGHVHKSTRYDGEGKTNNRLENITPSVAHHLFDKNMFSARERKQAYTSPVLPSSNTDLLTINKAAKHIRLACGETRQKSDPLLVFESPSSASTKPAKL